MTADEIIDGVLAREGGYRAAKTRPNGTVDPETMRGITWPTYRAHCIRHGKSAVHAQFLLLPAWQAREIYLEMYIADPGFTPENIPFDPLRVQLIDFGVNSGPERAVRWLQRVLRIEVTGKMDSLTVAVLRNYGGTDMLDGNNESALALVNDALVAARSYMIDRAVDQGTIRKADEEGLESRALSFFLAKP